MDETVKKITKRMSPKENRKRRKEECSVFLSYWKRESLWERISIFPYGRKISSAFIRDCDTDTVTEIPGQLTNGSLRLFRT